MARHITTVVIMLLLLLVAGCGNDDDADVLDIDDFQVTPFIEDLEMPGAMAFTPDGRLFFTEVHTGRIRVVEDGDLRDEPFADLEVARPDGYTEHGLLGLALHPSFDENGYVYAFYTSTDSSGDPVGQRIVRLTDQDGFGIDETILVDDLPYGPSCCHNGGRIIFGQDGYLYVTIGDIEQPAISQDPESPAGSVLRFTDDGAIPDDNPFGPDNPVYATGLRNPFGMTIHPETGDLFLTENGPDGYDEVNLIRSGGNYGWPEVQGASGEDEYIDPVWSTTTERVAPTGIVIPQSDDIPELAGRVLFCMWNLSMLVVLELDPDDPAEVVDQAELPVNCNLDVVVGPDGALYTSTDIRIYRYGPPESD
jgi:glucose/arabinose dehydrogenase